MASRLELAQHFEGFLPISKSVTVADALARLRGASKNFLVIVDNDNQMQEVETLVRADHLENLAGRKDIALVGVLTQLPALVVIEGDKTILDIADIAELSLLLEQADAPGVIVFQDKQVKGVVSVETIAKALPLSSIPIYDIKGLYGNPVTPERYYICHKCERDDPPPPRSPYREGYTPPDCPKHPWLHGPMERGDI